MKYIDPDGKSDDIRMGGRKLKDSALFDFIVTNAESRNLIGKNYSTDPDNVYVCTTFASEIAGIFSYSDYDAVNEYFPGGQLVIDNINILKERGGLIETKQGENPSEGVYFFYYKYKDSESGHTGIVYFDKNGNQKILHNGSNKEDGPDNVNLWERSSAAGDIRLWMDSKNPNGEIYFKKIEEDVWME